MPIQEWSDKIWVAKLGQESFLSDELASLRTKIEHAQAMPHIVLDFSEVNHVNSNDLSQLLRIRKTAIDHESHLKLAAINDGIWAIFMMTGLEKIFDFTPDTMTALAGLQLDPS